MTLYHLNLTGMGAANCIPASYELSPRTPKRAFTRRGMGPQSWLAVSGEKAESFSAPPSDRMCHSCSCPNPNAKDQAPAKGPLGLVQAGCNDGHGEQGQQSLPMRGDSVEEPGHAGVSGLGTRQIPHIHSPSNLRYALYSPRNRADLAAY